MNTRTAKIFACIMLVAMIGTMLCGSVLADGSHGFYMTTYSNVVDEKADGYMIDFYSDSDQALATYWSNMNFGMYTEATVKKYGYSAFKGGGAYGGLQILGNTNERKGIFSFWRYEYVDVKTMKKGYIYADAIVGKTTHYDNEGSGTSCVMDYPWKSSQWYRELLYCWTDEETGNTFAGNWYYDYEADEWTLFAYYDLKLVDSYIKGDISQFLENFSEGEGARYRSFRYKGIYFLSHENGEWVSSPEVYLRSDGNPKAFGEVDLGLADDETYVWAWVDGTSEIDSDELIAKKLTIKQDEKPSYGKPIIDKVDGVGFGGKLTVKWTEPKNGTPQLSYKVEVFDNGGNSIGVKTGTRPEVRSITFDDIEEENYKAVVTVTDVFGQSVSQEFQTEGYTGIITPDTTPSSTDTSAPVTAFTTPTNTPEETGTNNVGVIIGLAIAGVAVVAIAVTVVVIIVKKKK